MAQLDIAQDDVSVAEIQTSDAVVSGTWRWLCVKYFAECADYKRLDDRTRRVRRAILESTFEEPIAPGSPKIFANFPLSRMNADAVEVLRDRKIGTPEAANSRVKAIRQVFKFGVRKKHAPTNPARDVEYFKSGSTGFHTWEVDEVRQFEERHPVGTKARLALALLLFTGQRRSDVIGSESNTQRAASSPLHNSRAATASQRSSLYPSCRCSNRSLTLPHAAT
jgi:integrase